MSDPAADVDVEDIMRRFARQIATEHDATSPSRARFARAKDIQLPLWSGPPARIEIKTRYRLDDFLVFHDEDFVGNGYRGILRREPDAIGFATFLGSLHSGRLSKTEILGRLRYSREGRSVGVAIDGLLPAFLLRSLRRVPVVGRIVGIGQYFLRLPDIARNHERLEVFLTQHRLEATRRYDAAQHAIQSELHELHQRLARELSALDEMVEERSSTSSAQLSALRLDHDASAVASRRTMDELAGRMEAMGQTLTRDVRAVTELASHTGSAVARLEEGLAGVRAEQVPRRDIETIEIKLRQLDAEKAGLSIMEDRLQRQQESIATMSSELRLQRRRLEQGETDRVVVAEGGPPVAPMARRTRRGGSLDAFYVDFEARFRGAPAEIRRRLEAYVPLVRTTPADAAGLPVFDVGCGRGEWLEILRDNDVVAQGIDSNENMVALCTDAGLAVTLGDALEHLRSQPDASFRALTAFHVIEHLSFEQLIQLIDESLRVLCPGGIAIFETPNPENVFVGACNFYTDPTHRHPLPPVLMEFCL